MIPSTWLGSNLIRYLTYDGTCASFSKQIFPSIRE
jgi:hypothetical protein